jgi:hypothetical protein
VLDIEQAELDRRDASATAEAAVPDGPAADAPSPEAGGDSRPPPVCESNGDPCNDCIAASCCQEYSACLDDSECNKALVTYDMCAGSAVDGGASSCAETFGTKSALAESLVRCVFLQTCQASCGFKPLRSSCAKYCACMTGFCPNATYSQGTCEESCPLLSDEQIRCRAYHCEFAAADPGTHCQHAEGLKVCP